MSAIIQEYTYDDETHHLEEDEVLEIYKREKALHPDAMVILNDLNCGHWDVEVYTSEEEKKTYLQKRVNGILKKFANALKKI